MPIARSCAAIFAIVLFAWGASTAHAVSPCCADTDGHQCRRAANAFELAIGMGSTGCWENGDGTCIGGSPLQSCVCVGGVCFARYWSDSLGGVKPVYAPVSHEECTSAAKKGCCSPNHTPGPNCSPVSNGKNR